MSLLPARPSGSPPALESPPLRWRLRRVDAVAIFAFWSFFGVLTAVNHLVDGRGPGSADAVGRQFAFWLCVSYIWAAATPLIFWLAWWVNTWRRGWGVRALTLLAAGLVMVVVMNLARDFVWVQVLSFDPGRRAERTLLQQILRPWFLNDLLTYAGVIAAGFAREYFLRYRLRQEESIRLHAHAVQLQAQLADARLHALRMQINPHFLFNTLHAVSSLVERDPRGVRRMIARLSELLRYTLSGSSDPEIPLEQELDFLQKYLEIIRIRFQGNVEIEMRVAPETAGALVPSFALQPLVENAVKHGLSRQTGVGRIEVEARREGERLVLAVRDNGPGPAEPPAPESSGMGLRNVRERLEELYGPEHGLALREVPGGGAEAEIWLPFHTDADLLAGEVEEIPVATHAR